MRFRTLRRRLSEATAAHDWLEGVSTVLGIAFLLLAGVCVWGVVVGVTSWGDPDPAFRTTSGFLQATRGFGIVFLSLFGFVSAAVGWFFAGDAIRRLGRRLRRTG